MKRTIPTFALLLAAGLATTALPPATAASEPIVWKGSAHYTLFAGGYTVHEVSPGCVVSPRFDAVVAQPPATPASSRGRAECIPDVDPTLTKGRVPACTATLFAFVQGVAVLLGSAFCEPVRTFCAAVTGVCIATASATPSSAGGCDVLVLAGPLSAVQTWCTVEVVWT